MFKTNEKHSQSTACAKSIMLNCNRQKKKTVQLQQLSNFHLKNCKQIGFGMQKSRKSN